MFTLKVRTITVALIVIAMCFSTIMVAIAAGGWINKSTCHHRHLVVYNPQNPCDADTLEDCAAKPKFQVTVDDSKVDCFYGVSGTECRYKQTLMPEGEASCKWKNKACTEGTPATKVLKDDCEDRQHPGWSPHLPR